MPIKDVPIRRGTFLFVALACLVLLLASEIEAKGGKSSKSYFKKKSYTVHSYSYNRYPHNRSSYYGSGPGSGEMTWGKAVLIIIALAFVVLGVVILCHCLRVDEPDEQQRKVAEFLQLQETQRLANIPGQPPPMPMPMPMPYPNSDDRPPSPDWRVPPSSEAPLLPPPPFPVTSNDRDVEAGHIGWTFHGPPNQGVGAVTSNFAPDQNGTINFQPSAPQVSPEHK